MSTIFGIPTSLLFAQLFLGLINGSFYAILSLGIALIFGMMNITNFAHGSFFMMGAFVGWIFLNYLGVGYWWMLFIAPAIVGIIGLVLERLLMSRVYSSDPLFGLFLTFGLSLIIEGAFRFQFGSIGRVYPTPAELSGVRDLGFIVVPNYRLWVMLAALGVCVVTWLVIEKTPLGARMRAGTENAALAQALGVNVPILVTVTYGASIALAAFAGVLAAPIYSVNPFMGSNLMVVVFAVVVIGGMGSIFGAVVTGLALGLVEGLTKVIFPPASSTVVFVAMALVLCFKPAGLFGRSPR